MDIIIYIIAAYLFISLYGHVKKINTSLIELQSKIDQLLYEKNKLNSLPAESKVADKVITSKNTIISEEQDFFDADDNVLQPTKLAQPKKEKISFEQQYGARLPVWVGAIALIFAVFYLIRYSIDSGLLTPPLRVFLSVLFGIGLNFAAHFIRQYYPSQDRIAQASAGAGLVALYFSGYAATNLYHLIGPFTGFALLAVVTIMAVGQSIRYGAPIAVLSILGGFATPFLMKTSTPNVALLFTYLFVLHYGLLLVLRRQGWWLLIALLVAVNFLCVVMWLLSGIQSHEAIWGALFLLGVAFTIAFSQNHIQEKQTQNYSQPINTLAMSGSLALLAILVGASGFGFAEWLSFAILSCAVLFLSGRQPNLYRFYPALAALFVWILSFFGSFESVWAKPLILGLFAVLFIIGSLVNMLFSRKPMEQALLVVSVALLFFGSAYIQLHDQFPIRHMWELMAFTFAACFILLTARVKNLVIPDLYTQFQDDLRGLFAATATAFISIGLVIALKHEFIAVAFALQILALTWIDRYMTLNALNRIIRTLVILFVVAYIPQIISYLQGKTNIFAVQYSIRALQYPWFFLFIPALSFFGAYHFQKHYQDKRSNLMLGFAITLGVIGVYFQARGLMHPNQNLLAHAPSFFERGILTQLVCAMAFSLWVIGRKTGLQVPLRSAHILAFLILIQYVVLDLLFMNPYFDREQKILGWPLVNCLWITYVLPFLWLIPVFKQSNFEVIKNHKDRLLHLTGIIIAAWVFTSLLVRQFFHGEIVHHSIQTTSAELYTYSVTWLLLSLVVLLVGIYRQDRAIRSASLVLIIGVVGKVFLWDASGLVGLYRVASFLGLGLSLMALGWYYTRMVALGDKR